MRILAVIPARSGSRRLPGKNRKSLIGKPLIGWTIEFAKSFDFFSRIHVSTDCPEIAQVASDYGADPGRLRPAKLATDTATSVEVVIETLDWYKQKGESFDCVALLQPTTPVRFPERWLTAIEYIRSGNCQAVIGVREANDHPYLTYAEDGGHFLKAYCPNASSSTRSQDLPLAFCVNGALYLIKVDELYSGRTFCPPQTRAVICSEAVENIDIDTEDDWLAAESIITSWIEKCEH